MFGWKKNVTNPTAAFARNVQIPHQRSKMTNISASNDRHSFQKTRYLERKAQEGKTVDNDAETKAVAELFDSMMRGEQDNINDPKWAVNNLEYDLRTTDWILEKTRSSKVYAQNLYAAMCNRDFQKKAVLPILKEETWGCSWRYAGGIIAHMRQEGDYIDWYCSGIRDDYSNGYVQESVVTDEIQEDLNKLGWIVLDA